MRKIGPFMLSMLLVTSLTYALPDDRNQILQFSAETADFNQLTHQGVYTDHVTLDQGTTHLRANKAITYTDTHNKLTLAIAYGSLSKPVHFWTQPTLTKPLLHAYADILKYNPVEHWIELSGHARIIQGTDSMSAEHIRYDTLKHHVLTRGDKKTRTVFLIHPEKKP